MKKSNIHTIIQAGGAVVLPTETVYGLFAKALDEKAVGNVYRLKHRPKEKALTLNVASLNDVLAYSQKVPSFLKKLYQHFMPGPLTLILEANDQVPYWINSGLSTVGFRIPNHPKTLKIIAETGPLIGSSANISGQESGKKFEKVIAAFNQQVTGIADDRAISGQESTILDLSGKTARILRQGAITKEELLEVIPEIPFNDEIKK